MPRLQFKKFSDIAFIQSIDKPRFFRPLLENYKDYFDRQGIDIINMKNTDKVDRKLLQIFTQPDEEMPPALLEALYVLDDIADESGHDRILNESQRFNFNVGGIGDDLNPGEFAIAVFLKNPRLIRACHEKTLYRKVKNYQEYQGKSDRILDISYVKKKQKPLEVKLSLWFESKNRSSVCEIYAYEEEDEIKFQITHGRTYRTDGSINKRLLRSRIAYRPQKHDAVVFNNQTKVLKVNAQSYAEKDLYRKTFGEILFGDAEYFPGGDIYTLDPLRGGKTAVKLANGVEWARLTEVWIRIDDNQDFVQISKAFDLFASIEEHGRPILSEGNILRASFLLRYASGGRPRKLEIRPTNVAIYDRDRDSMAAEAFMKVCGFLKV